MERKENNPSSNIEIKEQERLNRKMHL